MNLERLKQFTTRTRVVRQTLFRKFTNDAQRRQVETNLDKLDALAIQARVTLEQQIATGRHTADGLRVVATEHLLQLGPTLEALTKPQRERRNDIQAARTKAGLGLLVRESGGYRDVRPAERALTPEQREQHREVRELLRREIESGSPFPFRKTDDRYLAALRAGDNPDLVRAIEDAPKGFELVSSLARSMANEERLKSFPELVAIWESQEREADIVIDLTRELEEALQEAAGPTIAPPPAPRNR